MQTSVQEIVQKVEEAPLADLVRISIDDVQLQMDSYLTPDMDSTSLYRRWEKQQWAVADLDFSADQQQWSTLDEGQRDTVRRTMILFFIGEQAVTDTLSPILHAAPHEDERIFLATQIADEARHTVFFQRFFEEVLGHEGGIHSAMTGDLLTGAVLEGNGGIRSGISMDQFVDCLEVPGFVVNLDRSKDAR